MKWIALIALCIIIASCNIARQPPRFNITAPQGWKRADTTQRVMHDSVVKLISPEGLFEPGLRAFIDLVVQHKLSGREAIIKEMSKGCVFFRVNGEGHTIIDNTNAEWLEISRQPGKQGTRYTERFYQVAKGGWAYAFVCVVAGDDFTPMKPYVDEVLKSFKVLE